MRKTRLRPVGVVGTGVLAFAMTIFGGGTALAAQEGATTGGTERYRFLEVEKCFMRKINKRRSASGLAHLERDPQLGFVARRHARAIAAERVVRHDGNYRSEITRWIRLGQNTGRGPRCKTLFRSFWASGPHRSNILGSWRFIGVGVERAGGDIYVQQVFESKRNPGNVYGTP